MSFLKKWLFLLVFVSFPYSGCKTTKNDPTSLETVIQRSIPNAFTTSYNNEKTYLLVVEEQTPDKELIKFLVIQVSNQKIVLEKKFRPGHVKWKDNSTIELLNVPGMIELNKSIEEYIRYISIPTHTK